MSATNSTSAGRCATGQRDNARSLLQRMHATPAKLVPLALNRLLPSLGPSSSSPPAMPTAPESDDTDVAGGLADTNGLGSRDVVIVRYEDSTSPHSRRVSPGVVDAVTAVHQWQLQVAALHTMRGGRVALVYAPGTRLFALSTFVTQLERLARRQGVRETQRTSPTRASAPTPASPDQAVADQQARVLAAVARLTVVACEDMEDLQVFCQSFQFPHRDRSDDSGLDAPGTVAKLAAATPLVVPLIVCFGLCGRGSYVFHYERAAGREVPVRHWLLCELRRRVPCALIVVEWPAVASTVIATETGHNGGHRSTVFGRDRVNMVRENSALAGPLDADTVARFTAPHHHYSHPSLHRPQLKRTRTGETTVKPHADSDQVDNPVAELTDSQFLYVSLSATGATLQKLRLSGGSSAQTSQLSHSRTSHNVALSRDADGQRLASEGSSSSLFPSSDTTRQSWSARASSASTHDRGQPRCVVEAQLHTEVHETDFYGSW